MLNQYIRIIWDDNGVVKDLSLAAQTDAATAFDFDPNQDKLYIGQYQPFNNFFVELGVGSTEAANVDVSLYSGNGGWKDVADTLDGTKLTGSFGQSGVIQFEPDRNETWNAVTDTSDEPEATIGIIAQLKLYNLYWARISFSDALSVSTTLKKIGYSFTNDEQMESIDPEIDNFLSSWQSGKADWSEQILVASQHLIQDLKAKKRVWGAGQLLRFEDISLACTYRTLALIYNKLGPGYEFQRNNAMDQYNLLLNVPLTVDKNANGQTELAELGAEEPRLVR